MVGGRKVARKHGDRGGNGSNIPNWKFFWIDPDVCCCFSRVDKKNRFIWRFSFNQEVMVALGSNWQ